VGPKKKTSVGLLVFISSMVSIMYSRLLDGIQVSTVKRYEIIFLKMFVKKVFQLVMPFLAHLQSTSSKKYSYMTPQLFD
jgi:hypothetical protein